MSSSSQLSVWYDSACPLCAREIALMRKLDWRKRIEFIDAVNPQSSCPVGRGEILTRFHAMENGRLLSGAAAFAAMWRAVPLLWPLGMMAKLPVMEWMLETIYLRFLHIRPRLQSWFS